MDKFFFFHLHYVFFFLLLLLLVVSFSIFSFSFHYFLLLLLLCFFVLMMIVFFFLWMNLKSIVGLSPRYYYFAYCCIDHHYYDVEKLFELDVVYFVVLLLYSKRSYNTYAIHYKYRHKYVYPPPHTCRLPLQLLRPGMPRRRARRPDP